MNQAKLIKYLIYFLAVIVIMGGGYMVGVFVPIKAETKAIPQAITQTINVPVDVPTQLKDFDNLEQLKAWVNNHAVYGVGTGLCGDKAIAYKDMAAQEGYYLSLQAVENGMIFGIKVIDISVPHMGNLALIGKDVYYVDPQTKGIFLIGDIN